MRALTGVDLPTGSPGGSVELLRDLYLAPDRPLEADVFMLSGPRALPGRPGERAPTPLTLSKSAGKQLDGPGFHAYVEALTAAVRERFAGGGHDLLHLQHLAFGATPALLRAFPGLPSVAFVHGTDLLFAADHPTQAAVLRAVSAAATRIVVPTTAMADLLTGRAPGAAERVVHIPWGVPDRLLAAPPPRRPRTTNRLRLLYAGRLTPEKGLEELLTAIARLDGVSLGVAAPHAEYRQLRTRRDVSAIRYLGWLDRDALWQAFGDHDALVVPSNRLEAFGLVAVEAQACGLPVIHQPVPGLAEVLGDTAWPADPADGPYALAAAVERLSRAGPAALAEVRAAGLRNAARYPLSRTARLIHETSTDVQERS